MYSALVIIFTIISLISAIVLVYAILTRPPAPQDHDKEPTPADQELRDNTTLIGYSTIGAAIGIIGTAASLYKHNKSKTSS